VLLFGSALNRRCRTKNKSKSPRRPTADGKWGFDPADYRGQLELARDINCPELAVIAILRNHNTQRGGKFKCQPLKFTNEVLGKLGIRPDSKLNTLQKLEDLGYVDVVWGGAGKSPIVTVLKDF